MSKAKKGISRIKKETALRVSDYSKIPYENLNNWIPAGSGNFEKTFANGNYRDSCSQILYEIKCENDPEEKYRKRLFSHCNKLDCSSCFISASSIKARKLDDRLNEFRRLSYRNGILLGKIVHFSLIINTKRENYATSKKYGEFKQNFIYPMLKDIGVIGGIMFLHIWSCFCLNCGKKEYNCKCEESKFEKRINMHIHILGFGYLMNAREFNEKYQNVVYRNHLPRRINAYYTAFYILSKIALWRSDRGVLMPSYNYFGYLHQSKFRIFNEYKIKLTDNCPKCKTPRKIDKLMGEKVQIERQYSFKVKKRHYMLEKINGLREIVKTNYEKNKKK